jgi:hypothetical protein
VAGPAPQPEVWPNQCRRSTPHCPRYPYAVHTHAPYETGPLHKTMRRAGEGAATRRALRAVAMRPRATCRTRALLPLPAPLLGATLTLTPRLPQPIATRPRRSLRGPAMRSALLPLTRPRSPGRTNQRAATVSRLARLHAPCCISAPIGALAPHNVCITTCNTRVYL